MDSIWVPLRNAGGGFDPTRCPLNHYGSRSERVDPVFAPLWELPEFQAFMSEVEAEMAGQLANLREMKRNGELAAIPRGQSSLH